MREIIFVGARDWVVATRQHWMDRTRDLADALGLRGTFETATDPFFAAGARGRKLMQQLKELKIELRMDTGEADSAVASFNLHETFFSRRFDISLADGEPAWSGCAAFGIERWTLAMAAQRRAAPQARPRERSGDRGAPASDRVRGFGGTKSPE